MDRGKEEWTRGDDEPPLRPVEIATGLALGPAAHRDAVPIEVEDPVAAIERAVLRALVRPPCLVTFSGGRDSSLLLAFATRVARWEALPLPIPVTYRVSQDPGMEESDWQEMAIRFLNLTDWVVLRYTTELDCVGSFAVRILERHGLLWPFNLHTHAPLLAAAKGGSLISGVGGDEVFSPARTGRLPLLPRGLRDLRRRAYALSPTALRVLVLKRRNVAPPIPWIHPNGWRDFTNEWARWAAQEPTSWHRSRLWFMGRRYVALLRDNLALIAADAGTAILHPFLEAGVINAVANEGGAAGYFSRTEALQSMFPGFLPEALLARRTKATGQGAFFSDHSRKLVSEWSGNLLNVDLVDPTTLRQEWMRASPDPHSFSLLQWVWLQQNDHVSENSVD